MTAIPTETPQEQKPDDDYITLKKNLIASFTSVVDFIGKSDTSNPTVLDLIKTCVDGLDSAFEALSSRFDTLPESPESDNQPDYSAEEEQGNNIPIPKEASLGALVLAKALRIKIPDTSQVLLEPSKAPQWKAISNNFIKDVGKVRGSLVDSKKPAFFLYAGLCISTLEELLSLLKDIMNESDIKQWKRVINKLKIDLPGAARSIKQGQKANKARELIWNLADMYTGLQGAVEIKERHINDMTKKVRNLIGNRS